MRAAPVLAGMATAAGVVDLLWTRLWVRVLSDRQISGLSIADLVELKRGGDLIRNIVGIAGLVALGVALTQFIQPRPSVPLMQRIGLAGFAGVFLPTVLLAIILPADRTTALVVLFASGAANILAVLLSVASFQRGIALRARFALVSIALTAFFAFASTVILLVGRITLWELGYPLGMLLRQIGEAAYLAALVLLAFSCWPRDRKGAALALPGTFGVIAAASTFGVFVLAYLPLEDETFGGLLYGAMHADLFAESAPLSYAVVMSIAFGAAAMGLFSREPAVRQGSLGTMLLAAAGFGPTTPLTLLLLVLAVALVARSIVSQVELHAQKASERELKAMREEFDDLLGDDESTAEA
ncbi:MAG: hypothetical protein AAGE52_08445 [Myxococcota bacterium]